MSSVPPGVSKWAEQQSEEAWELAERLEPILRKQARKRDPLIRYASLSSQVGRFQRDPVFLTALGLISYKTLVHEGYAISAIVVNESGLPGSGFYGLVGGSPKPDEEKKIRLFVDQYNKITRR